MPPIPSHDLAPLTTLPASSVIISSNIAKAKNTHTISLYLEKSKSAAAISKKIPIPNHKICFRYSLEIMAPSASIPDEYMAIIPSAQSKKHEKSR